MTSAGATGPTRGASADPADDVYAKRRAEMVERQLVARDIVDTRLLDVMAQVPRERFVRAGERDDAYEDNPLPIGFGQTISQPYVVALMTQALALEGHERVLEIGTGSGYQAAVLGLLCREVYSIERIAELAERAAQALRDTGLANVRVRAGDGTLGWPERAPFDAIIVTAGGPAVPVALRQQLAVGGCLVMPVGDDPQTQQLLRVTRAAADRFETEPLGPVRFVPLVGEQGWPVSPGSDSA
ncbi:MAG: protein-L-isoaspartate(D-aspartate) O-methyltransferase [Burkholderiaceae bacterium]